MANGNHLFCRCTRAGISMPMWEQKSINVSGAEHESPSAPKSAATLTARERRSRRDSHDGPTTNLIFHNTTH
eukprot:3284684-Pyramimonas_sp.AAC.1